MRRLRRFATFLVLPLVLQLALSASAIACVGGRTAPAASAHSTGDTPGMDMSTPTDRSKHSPRTPCNGPFGTGACQPLAACAAGVVVPAALGVPAVVAAEHAVTTLVVLAPASRTTRPELPPPRA